MPSRAEAAPAYLYVADLGGVGATVTLSESESHYLTRVCRARRGDSATATDGKGAVATLEIVSPGKRVEALVTGRSEQVRARSGGWLLSGPPEGERADWMVEKLAELGIEVFQPIDCERGVWGRAQQRHQRWLRLAIAALRQSRGAHLMEVREPLPLDAVLAALDPAAGRWMARQGGGPALRGPDRDREIGLIGPAAGLTEAESASLDASGFLPIALSEGRLRTETAALAWAAWWARG